MYRFIALCMILAALAVIPACDDDNGVTPKPGPLIALTVVDTAGNPLAGMNVGRINHSDFLARRTPPPLALPSTNINFSLPESGPVTLSIYNYHDSLIERPFDNEILAPGSHTITWDTSDDLPGFYRYELITSDTTLSSWTVLEVGADPQQTVVGQTNSDGLWTTDDTLLIPCLLANPPEVVVRNEVGYVIDTTADYYNDTVTFHLSNPALPDSFQYFQRPVSPNGNEFKLIWE